MILNQKSILLFTFVAVFVSSTTAAPNPTSAQLESRASGNDANRVWRITADNDIRYACAWGHWGTTEAPGYINVFFKKNNGELAHVCNYKDPSSWYSNISGIGDSHWRSHDASDGETDVYCFWNRKNDSYDSAKHAFDNYNC